MGIVRPRGGLAGPREHNLGNTQSPFTSWTLMYDVAAEYAGPPGDGGVILRDCVDPSELVRSPDLLGELEVLRKGVIHGVGDIEER